MKIYESVCSQGAQKGVKREQAVGMLPVPQIDEQQKDFYIRIGLTLSITTFYLYFSFDIYSLGET